MVDVSDVCERDIVERGGRVKGVEGIVSILSNDIF